MLQSKIIHNEFFFVEQQPPFKRQSNELSSESGSDQSRKMNQFTVDLRKVLAEIALIKAKLLCNSVTTTNDTLVLHKVLTELKHYSLAVHLAFCHNESPAYALAN